ncbi:RagB/SusD family nutrient uptake outer membrane protein [Sphingobacterium sp.]|jgi:tetratricopeptide (TPR) repeat protein|uniref:RagB/SusD family nutrient uptake outer membrane protein n=1 Tax=Sphingobacterium sp. TaxID=341027 RepID=UPI002852B4E3|nr:RagB/SusD family nutrient uptake outer membrane protein [Sphingobacterium sp.]
MKTTYYKWLLYAACCLCIASCKKFLEEKPDSKLNTPGSNIELVAILDNHSFRNPGLLEVASDNYYLTDANFKAISTVEYREAYLWSKEPTENALWSDSYITIFYSNVVLDYLDKVNYLPDGLSRNELKGMALYHRAFSFYSLAQVFCKYYNKDSENALGIVLKTKSDINEKLQRSTLGETYNQILQDLEEAVGLLSEKKYEYPTRPNKTAALALLSRIYLGLGQYDKSLAYADRALATGGKTIDYNQIKKMGPRPFDAYNDDILFYALMIPTSILLEDKATVDTLLYNSYAKEDRRKELFFTKNANGTYAFTGNYNPSGQEIFIGLTVGEVLLNKAEAECRAGKLSDAKLTLMELLKNRYSEMPILPVNEESLLEFILLERRRELVFRGLRWTDLRRYAAENRIVDLKRRIDGEVVSIQGKSVMEFAYKIPLQVIERGGIEQNP